MKRFIGEIKVEDSVLACDIIKALETQPDSGRSYEIEMFEGVKHRDFECSTGCVLKIFSVEYQD
jgi:hypothetical protein